MTTANKGKRLLTSYYGKPFATNSILNDFSNHAKQINTVDYLIRKAIPLLKT